MLAFMQCIQSYVCFIVLNMNTIPAVNAGIEPGYWMNVDMLVEFYIATNEVNGCMPKLCSEANASAGNMPGTSTRTDAVTSTSPRAGNMPSTSPRTDAVMDTSPHADVVTGSSSLLAPTDPRALRILFPSDCCGACSCHEDCNRYGSCCPDRLRTFPIAADYPYGGIFECVHPQVRTYLETKYNRDRRIMVSRCPLNYTDSAVVRKCELPRTAPLKKLQDIELHIPLTDTGTKETYRNRFCAECNSASLSECIPWQMELKCKTELLPHSFDTLVTEVHESPDCNLIFNPPAGYYKTSELCTDIPLIATCNATGKWPIYDAFTDTACRAFSAPYLRTYRNVFCYMCNINPADHKLPVDRRPAPLCSGMNKEIPGIERLPLFSLILDFRPVTQETVESKVSQDCSTEAVYDPWKGVCRDIHCPDMTELHAGECRSIIVSAPDLCHEAFLKVTPVLAPISKTMEVQLGRQLLKYVQSKVWNLFVGRGQFSVQCRTVERISLNSGNELDLDYSIAYFVIHFLFHDIRFLNTILSVDKTNVLLPVSQGKSSPSVDFTLELDRFVSYPTRDRNSISERVIYDSEKHILRHIGTISTVKNASTICPGEVHLLTPLSQCPMIRLNISNIRADFNKSRLSINEINMYLSPVRFSDHGDGTVLVCVSDYIPQVEEYTQSSRGETHVQPDRTDVTASILTFIGAIVSLACLVVTIVTYAMFSVLRTQPGINNMMLSITLLGAQTMFISVANRTDLGVGCSMIGAVIHFLFEAVIFWMAVCCVHMFRVFRNLNTTIPDHNNLKTTCAYLTVVCGLSLGCVIINIITSYLMSSGSDIGYGASTSISSICYITSSHMIGYTASLPAVLVVGFNVILFSIVVCRINTLPTVQCSTVEQRRYFSVYVKLSTLTGVTWLSLVPYYATDIMAFAYISNALISLQGLFPFLAFIANKRVFRLYAVRLFGDRKAGTSTSTTASVKETQ